MPNLPTFNAEESATYIRGMAKSIAFGSEEKHRLIEAADHMVRLLMRLNSSLNSAAASVLRSARYEPPSSMSKALDLGASEIDKLTRKVERLEAQIPRELYDRRILFEECEKGHGRLRGENWIISECPYCKIKRLETENAAMAQSIKAMTRDEEAQKNENQYRHNAVADSLTSHAMSERDPVKCRALQAGADEIHRLMRNLNRLQTDMTSMELGNMALRAEVKMLRDKPAPGTTLAWDPASPGQVMRVAPVDDSSAPSGPIQRWSNNPPVLSGPLRAPAAPDLYLVWNTARGLPSHQHGSVESAVQECQRLAKTNPGQRFLVMAPIGAAQVAMADFRYFDGCADRYSFIPF